MGIFFVGVGKDTQALKFHALHKVYHLLKFFFPFTRMPCNQGGTDRNLWDQVPDTLNQLLLLFSGSTTTHGLEHIRGTVLERDI